MPNKNEYNKEIIRIRNEKVLWVQDEYSDEYERYEDVNLSIIINSTTLEAFKKNEQKLSKDRSSEGIVVKSTTIRIGTTEDLDVNLLEYLHKHYREELSIFNYNTSYDNYRDIYQDKYKDNVVTSLLITVGLAAVLAFVSAVAGFSLLAGGLSTIGGALIVGLGYFAYSNSNIYENTNKAYSKSLTGNSGRDSHSPPTAQPPQGLKQELLTQEQRSDTQHQDQRGQGPTR